MSSKDGHIGDDSTAGFPAFFEPHKVHVLVNTVYQAGTTLKEKRAFLSILRRLREEAYELEMLYSETCGVLRNRAGAKKRFLEILRQSGSMASLPVAAIGKEKDVSALPANRKGNQWAASSSLIGVDKILLITNAIDVAAGDDESAYAYYMDVLGSVWCRTARLERIYRYATGDDPAKRIRAEFRLIIRDLEKSGWPFAGQQDSPFFEGRPDGEATGGETGLLPGDLTGWPGPDDGPPVPGMPGTGWPGDRPPVNEYERPRRPPVIPPDFDEFQAINCRRMVLAGARGLRPRRLPTSVWADNISMLAPVPACAGEPLTIYGTGFGSSQPAGVVVMIGEVVVRVISWSDTEIVVEVPANAKSGHVGFRDEHVEGIRRTDFIQGQRAFELLNEGLGCFRLTGILGEVFYFPSSPPATPYNFFPGTLPEIRFFNVNGASSVVVEPGTPLVFSWDILNATSVHIYRTGSHGPILDITDPPGNTVTTLPFAENTSVSATYRLDATNRCGAVTATVEVRLRKVPVLKIEGVELTQGIQTFWSAGVPWNAVETVAGKDTIVRVYVSADLGGFENDEVSKVTGSLTIGTIALPPINGGLSITAKKKDRIKRNVTNDTLNFRIPAALAQGNQSMIVQVAAPAVESPRAGFFVVPKDQQIVSRNWVTKQALKVRYVRVSDGYFTTKTDPEARALILRAFDFLPSPPTDIAPARIATWHTSVDYSNLDGMSELLGHVDDQHDCSLSESIFPWEDDCPDDDGAKWVGILPIGTFNPAGLAQGWRLDFVSGEGKNTAIVSPEWKVAAHEIGHMIGLKHVNSTHCGIAPEGPFDDLPIDGRIEVADVFDITKGECVPGISLFDFMSYACERWVSRGNWERMLTKF